MQFLHICSSASTDSTNHGLYSTAVFTIEKISAYKWTRAIQTHAFQKLTYNISAVAAKSHSWRILESQKEIWWPTE